MELTPEEKKAIAALKRVAKIWPKSLWLFSADSILYIMRKQDEKHVMSLGLSNSRGSGGGVNPDYIVDTVRIDSDGGDW